MEGSKQKDCVIKHISADAPVLLESGSLVENSKHNENVEENVKMDKLIQNNAKDSHIGKISCSRSEKTDRNVCTNVKDLCSGVDKDGSSAENSELKNVTTSWSATKHSFGKRKSHKSYMISWGTQISCEGFAKCLIETCNFISLDLQTMQHHYKSCDGIPNYDFNLCNFCNSWLPSEDELIIHESRCKNKRKTTFRTSREERDLDCTKCKIKEENDTSYQSAQHTKWNYLSVENNTQALTNEIKFCCECNKEFLCDADYSQHLLCKKSSNDTSPTTEIQKKEAITLVKNPVQENINHEDQDSPIVQSGWHIPKGKYVRRRAYTKQHKIAWESALDKYKYVKCMFQNCHFLALSLEDMISHYGYCNGDGSFAKFVCPFCRGRLTSKNFLEVHVGRSHTFKQSDESYFRNMKSVNDDSQASSVDEKRESSGDDKICLQELQLQFPEEAPEVEVTDSFDQSINKEQIKEPDDLQQDHKSDSESQINTRESAVEYSHHNTSARNIQHHTVEELNLLKEHNPETLTADTSEGDIQKDQYPLKIYSDRDHKDDHIYFKRKIKKNSESKDLISVMKNKNSKHYLGRKCADEEILSSKGEETLPEKEGNNEIENEQLQSSKIVSGLDKSGKNVKKNTKNLFPIAQNIVKREILPSYTTSWIESIKTNGFARCLVATCNFISLDIFHIENHFKNCNGVPEKGPNLCTFCDSRLPSAVELWIHTSMCQANGEVNISSTDISQSLGEFREDHVSKEIGESSNAAEAENGQKIHGNENKLTEELDSFKHIKDAVGAEITSKKDKMNSLRISDIMKLKDNGTMDYNRIIQPGPVWPKGHYVRRRSYTKAHKAVWEDALEKHKYVKCVFQNCHFVAMSLEDMIYHFGYCIGDGSFAKFQCPYCGGRLTTKVVLDIHIQISHSDKMLSENDQKTLMSSKETEGMLPYTLEDWKKLIAKRELKTYCKNKPQYRKTQVESEDAIRAELLLETSQDGCSSSDAPSFQEMNHQTQTAPELGDEDSGVNNSATNVINNEVNSSNKNQTPRSNNVNNKSLEFQTSQATKRCRGLRSNKTNAKKNQAVTATVANMGKSVDFVEISNESDVCSDAPDNIMKTPKNICNPMENSNISYEKKDSNTPQNLNDEGKSSNANTLSLVVQNNSNTQKQNTGNGKQEKTKEENNNSNKNDQKIKNDTKLKRKRGRRPKSLGKEDVSEKEHDKEVLDKSDNEGTSYEANDPEGSQKLYAKLAKIEPVQNQDNPSETPCVSIRKRGRPPKTKSLNCNMPEEQVQEVVEDAPQDVIKGKRGKKRKLEMQENNEIVENNDRKNVKCAKCGFETKRKLFSDHNYKKHVGLSWIEGENPIDLNEESTVSWNIKQAFRYVKSATCVNCGSVKKSALGFISHMQKCGKSEEEKDALKVQCPHCPSRILKYSLPMHMKLSHSVLEGKKLPKENVLNEKQPSKRKSALRAVNKFCEVLKQENDEDDMKKKVQYVTYKKGVSKFPKLPYKIRGLWNKMIKEKKKIPCRRGSCLFESTTIQKARNHHFLCSELPQISYVCQLCDYYSESKANIQQHMKIHSKGDGNFVLESDEKRFDEEAEMKYADGEENDFVQNKSRISLRSSEENALEASYKARFFVRERLLNERQTRFCRRSLRMTLEYEMDEVRKGDLIFPELRTQTSDWIPIESEYAAYHFPSLEESMQFRVCNNKKKNGSDWKRIKRFMGEIVEDSAVIFTGGSILSMSWCKYSCVRSSKQNLKQYLAISSSKKMDKFQNIHEERRDFSHLIQIYCCGEMKILNEVGEAPELAIGIVHDYGEVWDLAWFPIDAFEEYENETFLRRIGLLGAACQDGTIRIWPICDTDELKPLHSLPMYKINPKVTLKLEDTADTGCLQLAIGRTGIVAGGYADGIVAVWNLKNISSPFCKKDGKSFILKPHISFQAHRTSITALSICQNSDRYISTSGLDRFIKFWDLELPGNPFESIQREVCLDNVWPKHWPLTISTFENIAPCSGKGMIKGIRDVYFDKHRTPLALEGSCWSLSFNEWLNILCGCNNIGEVKIRFMRNMFLTDEKCRYKTGSKFCATELKLLKDTGKESLQENADADPCKGNSKKSGKKMKENLFLRTYEEAHKYFGLIFHDFDIEDDSKHKTGSSKAESKDFQSIEEYPIASVNKVCWNPNYKRFMQIAIGHHCGIVRIKPLNDSKCNDEVLQFLDESEGEISKFYTG